MFFFCLFFSLFLPVAWKILLHTYIFPKTHVALYFLHTLGRPTATIESTSPPSVLGDVQVPKTHVGATQTLCVQGESPLTNTSWTKAGLEIPAVSVSHTGCFTCGCLLDTNLTLSLGASPSEPRYSAFQVLGADCSGVVDFVSLLVIKNVTFGDGGNYVFIISPREFPTTKTFVVPEPGKSLQSEFSLWLHSSQSSPHGYVEWNLLQRPIRFTNQ